MEALWTSIVAVTGTLLGAVVTHVFQRKASQRTERFTRDEALRRERIATYTAFAAAAEEYRRGMAERWYRSRDDPDGPAFRTARAEAHQLRTAARQALYRVQLLTDEPEVLAAADRAYVHTRDIGHATEQETWQAADRESKESIEAFVARAGRLLR